MKFIVQVKNTKIPLGFATPKVWENYAVHAQNTVSLMSEGDAVLNGIEAP